MNFHKDVTISDVSLLLALLSYSLLSLILCYSHSPCDKGHRGTGHHICPINHSQRDKQARTRGQYKEQFDKF